MLSREQARVILKRIVSGRRPGVTLAVWEAARTYAEMNTGRILVSAAQLADDAGTTPREVHRAMSQLVRLGALVRTERGRYALNPEAAWSGSLASREGRKAELRLV
jgi:hypothetical protein